MIYVDLYKFETINIDWSTKDFETPETNDTYWGKERLYKDFIDAHECDMVIGKFIKKNNILRAKWTNTNFYFVALTKCQLIDFLDEVYDEKWENSKKSFWADWITTSNKIKDFCKCLPDEDYILRFDYDD